jgi:hypothetical protein
MVTAKRVYGHLARTALQVALNSNLCTQESFAAYLSSLGCPVDRSQISRWSTGQDHVPGDVIVHLAQHTGEPELVFGVLLEPLGCSAVHLPEGLASGREVTRAALEIGAAVGRLQSEVAISTDPDGDSGSALSTSERAALRNQVQDLAQQLMDLDRDLAETSPVQVVAPKRVTNGGRR